MTQVPSLYLFSRKTIVQPPRWLGVANFVYEVVLKPGSRFATEFLQMLKKRRLSHIAEIGR